MLPRLGLWLGVSLYSQVDRFGPAGEMRSLSLYINETAINPSVGITVWYNAAMAMNQIVYRLWSGK